MFNNIPTLLIVENNDIISPFITEMYNESMCNSEFLTSLKLADITPAHKKNERTKKDNYRPITSLLFPIPYYLEGPCMIKFFYI